MEALLVTIQKTAWPQRLESLSRDFNRHPSALSRMTTWVMRKYVNDHHERLFGDVSRFRPFVRRWIAVARAKGMPFDGVGAIDGTRLGVARPGRYQEVLYNGYVGGHCIVYLVLVGLNGLVLTMHGPVVGTRHDAHLFEAGGFRHRLAELLDGFDAFPDRGVAGDSAFGRTRYVFPNIKSTKAHRLLPGSHARAFNKASSVLLRIIFEWGIKQTKTHWKTLSLTSEMQIWRHGGGVGNLFRFATFLSNAMACLRGGNQISTYYGLEAPSFEWYMS